MLRLKGGGGETVFFELFSPNRDLGTGAMESSQVQVGIFRIVETFDCATIVYFARADFIAETEIPMILSEEFFCFNIDVD